MSPVLFINVEGGVLSVSDEGKDIDATGVITKTSEVDEIFWALAKGDGELSKYKTVCLDSVTELQSINLDEILAADSRHPSALQLQHYGESTKILKRIFRHLKNLPMNVIMTALAGEHKIESTVKNGQPRLTSVHPQLTAKLMGSLMGYVDHVWNMYYDDGKRYIITSKVGVTLAKTRQPSFAEELGVTVENPNLSTIYDMLQKAGKNNEQST